MKKSDPGRGPANISDHVRHRLNAYALGATAAGVAIFALAPLGEAEIVYTPADQVIGPGASYSLDLNGDGKTDFYFKIYSFGNTGYTHALLQVGPGYSVAGNAVVAKAKRHGDFAAKPLQSHARIGPKTKSWGASRGYATMAGLKFFDTWCSKCMPSTHISCSGPWWMKYPNRYVGLKFTIDGEVHYGWARLSVSCGGGDYKWYLTAGLSGYAYETIPNQAIKAGQEFGTDDGVDDFVQPLASTPPQSQQIPATLGALAKGASALGGWRKE